MSAWLSFRKLPPILYFFLFFFVFFVLRVLCHPDCKEGSLLSLIFNRVEMLRFSQHDNEGILRLYILSFILFVILTAGKDLLPLCLLTAARCFVPQHDKRGSFSFLLFVILNDSEGSLVSLFTNRVGMLRSSA